MKAYREFLFVGGMPEVVQTFLENDDISATLKAQRNIITSYRDDISKYAGKNKLMVKNMFDAIPAQLAKENKRFIIANLEKGAAAQKYEDATTWLADAGTGYRCFNLSRLEFLFSFYEKRGLYKLYMHDTGLLCSQSGMAGIQNAILMGDIDINEGGITENAVAAELAKRGIPLYYYDKKSRRELDFIVGEGNAVSAIEVKSGKYYHTHAALDNMIEEREKQKKPLARAIVLSKNNTEQIGRVIYYPLYMAAFI
jgi:predicted AAA+ superfamily ATPase